MPGNDDWVYMRAASSLFHSARQTYRRRRPRSGGAYLVHPLLWLSGGSSWAFTAFGLSMAVVAVASTYLLARSYVETGSAALVVVVVLAFPSFARVSASFMTDVPAFALAMLCLLLGTRWLRNDDKRVLVLSLVAGIFAVSIRQFALAAPIAVLAASWVRNRPEDRFFLTAATTILVVGLGAVLLIPAAMPGHVGYPPPAIEQLLILAPTFATLSAVLLPVAVLAMAPRLRTFSTGQILVAAALVCFIAALVADPLVGNLWTPNGLGANKTPCRHPAIRSSVSARHSSLASWCCSRRSSWRPWL